jgi:hypothetical protein
MTSSFAASTQMPPSFFGASAFAAVFSSAFSAFFSPAGRAGAAFESGADLGSGAAFAPSAGTQGYAVAVQRPTCCEVGQKLGISVCDKCANEGADYQSLLGPRDRNEEPGA